VNKILKPFFDELGANGEREVRTDRYSRMFYSTDASIYQVMPYGVLIPRSTDDVQAAVELANKYGVPLLPRTAGSSLVGQAVNEALIIDFTRHLDGMLEINKEEHWVRVQPGIVLDELNLSLRKHGLQFGPDPASSNRAAIGGIVSNNSTGAHSILYGMSADHVLEMEVILSDGSLVYLKPVDSDQLEVYSKKGGLEGDIYRQVNALVGEPINQKIIHDGTPHHWRRCGGYNLDRMVPANGYAFKYPSDSRFNLANLVCGAEGSLAVITEVKLNLVPLPQMTALAIVHFDNLFTALTAVPAMLEVEPAAIELLDNLGLTLCRNVPEYARLLSTFIEGEPNCVLITEFYGHSESELREKVEKLKSHLKGQNCGAIAVNPAFVPELQGNIWKVRKVGLGLMMSIKGDHKPIPFIEDAAVPVENLAEYVEKVERFCHDIGSKVAYYAHASAGCLHIRPLLNTKTATEVAKLPEIASFAVDLLHGYGGSLSSEHGDGRARSWLNERFFGKDLYNLYAEVKDIFDPNNLLNPGTVVNAGPMTENLRFGEIYQTTPVNERVNFDNELGLDRAIEMCNGAGVCRKKTTGTMCPSFMVTREEEHSTRGRANALRAAMSGALPQSELTSQRMFEVMDLCVECKACKAECPSAVDMTKIKLAFLDSYWQKNGVPLRTRLFGDIARISRLSSGWKAPLINGVLKSKIARQGTESILNISANRTMPSFAKQPFTNWFHSRSKRRVSKSSAEKPKVVLFNDTFNTFYYPQTSIAATEVLEACGFEVLLPGHQCCGRPLLSKGLVDKATKAARDTVNKLAPFAEEGIPIVGLEPSCLLSMRDEYLYLLPEDQRTQTVAEKAFTFEEFIAQLVEEGSFKLDFEEDPRDLVLHGHCHQKAITGTEPSKTILSLPQGYTVTEADSGCCGMAGSFGYEAEHYELSMAMAERRLLPAVRNSGSNSIIVAAGASCRDQIKHGTGRTALHPAEVLYKAMRSTPRD
jgi:FAD/FMN-containing dehydrogenase/Fe-S oxidoreductase